MENPLEPPIELEKPELPRELEKLPLRLVKVLGVLEKLPEKLETLVGGMVGAAVTALWLLNVR